ncbi:hypothetical protein [Bacillus toyonensis]|uniref:hypothetical protein n=1 Tax=Bacillus toyonensis TaxID=155322 RepID=UPI00211D7F51|nr:hypothetical protein [Bacillus toyonensis]
MQTDILQSAVAVIDLARTKGLISLEDSYVVEVEKTGVGVFQDPYSIMLKGNYKLAKYRELEHLFRLLREIDLELQPVLTVQTRHHGKVTILKSPKEFKLEVINSPKKFPKTSIKSAKGIVSGRVVDVALDVKKNEVVLYQPKSICIRNGFNETGGVLEFLKENGSLNIVK